jgi:hypothetical protein
MSEREMLLAEALREVHNLVEMRKFVKKISQMSIADEDSDDETEDKIILKNIIIEARSLKGIDSEM